MIYRLQIHVFHNLSETEVRKEEQIWEMEKPDSLTGINPILLQSETPWGGIQNNVFTLETCIDGVATYHPVAGHFKNFPLLEELSHFGFRRVEPIFHEVGAEGTEQ